MRTVRYTEEELRRLTQSDEYVGLSFTLKDRFGDNGIISFVLLRKQGNALFVDTWVMSCRVLQRTVEFFVLNEIITLAKKERFELLVGEHIQTEKNGIVKDHYSKMGFYAVDGLWKMDINRFRGAESFIQKEEMLINSKRGE